MKRITLPLLLLCLALLPAFTGPGSGPRAAAPAPVPTPKAPQSGPPAPRPAAATQRSVPNTTQPDPALTALQEQAGKLDERVRAAEAKAEELEGRLDRLPTATTAQTDPYERWGVIGGVAASLLGLGLLGAVTLRLRKRFIRSRNSLMAIRRRTGRAKDGQAKKHGDDADSYAELFKAIEAILAEQKKELLDKISELEARVDELSKRPAEPPRPPTQEPAPTGDGRGKAPLRINHPATVDEYLMRSQEAQLTLLPVKWNASVFGNLAQDDDNRFWLARDNGSREGILFPKARRFGSDDEFYTFYDRYYECAEPSAGDVLIVSPGIVEEDEQHGGWRVKTKGVLKVE